jgi:hypothetical protein
MDNFMIVSKCCNDVVYVDSVHEHQFYVCENCGHECDTLMPLSAIASVKDV